MPPQLTALVQRLGRTLGGFTTGQKVIAALALVGVLIGGAAFTRWVGQPTYAPLFSNLAGSDASAIVDQLNSDGVKYELQDGGQTILVPKDVVYAERVKLSGQGLPAAESSGYSLLDQQGVTASQFQQQVTYQRALEGELAKTVQAINGVQSAVVHLAIPQKDVFLDQQKQATASVLVSTRPGATVSSDQVQSIVHLVASSIEGMDPAQVTVVDGKGQLLSSPTEGGAGAGSGSREEMRADYEARQVKNLQGMLDRVLGPGRAVAQVTAQLNFDAIESTNEKLTSNPNTAPVAETTTTESYKGAGGGVGGVLGTDNLAVPSNSSGNGSYDKKATTKNNSVSKETTKTKAAPGAVSRQSVSVVVDAKTPGLQIGQIQQMVTTAAGVDAKRGDTISVTSLPFDNSSAAAAAAELKKADEAQQKQQLMGYLKQGAIALALLLALLVFWLKRRKKKKADAGMPLHLLELDVVDPPTALSTVTPDALSTAAPLQALPPALEVPDGPSAAARRREEVAALVERQPEEVAELLRGWLADRRS
ncbi:MAG TPA: flagellar basal-body MS-ring/collar protein FliF [Actinomycetales bacterium]|nr:flagellar basal-body MS-ring/collar protein FliF [Actinomycetales bacterium]